MKTKNKTRQNERIRLIAILIVSLLVIVTGTLFAYSSFRKGDIGAGVLGIIIAVTILGFALIVLKRGNKDLREGYPLKDERSKRVMEKASSVTFYISLYVLLGIGFLSEDWIKFRDVSQATSIAVGCMALLFLILWIYYNRKEL
jgi:uncharacterized membrane protein